MKTTFVKPEELKKQWYLIDGENLVLGKIAVKAAQILRGKNKPEYAPDRDCGDFVVITNAAKIKITGNKLDDKTYFKYTGYVGNAKYTQMKKMMEQKPDRVIYLAIKGMLPKNRLGRKLLTKVRIYSGAEHQQKAQNPIKIEL